MARVGHAVLVTNDVMDPDAFFAMVDEFLTPAMAELGYHRIGGFSNDQPLSRGVLTRPGSVTGRIRAGLLPHRRCLPSRRLQAPSPQGGAPFLLYDFGFEAGSDDVQRLVDPEDPESAEELWLSYEPATGELDLHAWNSVAAGRVDWDFQSDTGPCSEHEVRRRLAAMGSAVAAFAQSQAGPPPTP